MAWPGPKEQHGFRLPSPDRDAARSLGHLRPDAIYFNIGSGVPVIKVTADLPAITQALTICGSCGGHGATHIELHGPGS